jgi:hypothetical protein
MSKKLHIKTKCAIVAGINKIFTIGYNNFDFIAKGISPDSMMGCKIIF